MNHLQTYENMNESFRKQALIYGGLLLLMHFLPKFYTKSDARYLMSCMQQQKSKPSLFIENKVDSLRKYLNVEIDNSNFKYKKELKDSINIIPIFSADLSKVAGGHAVGCQILFNNIDMHKNVIFVDDNITNESVSGTLLHEMYHFISEYEKLDYAEYLDKKAVSNENLFLNKVSLIYYGKKYDDIPTDGLKKDLKEISEMLYEDKKYLTSNEEISVRILEMKNWLIVQGKIKSVTDPLSRADLKCIMTKASIVKQNHFMEVLPFLNIFKLFNLK